MLKKLRFYKNLAVDFTIFENNRQLSVFSTEFDVNVETVPDEFQ
jgi:hypothetical protein